MGEILRLQKVQKVSRIFFTNSIRKKRKRLKVNGKQIHMYKSKYTFIFGKDVVLRIPLNEWHINRDRFNISIEVTE